MTSLKHRSSLDDGDGLCMNSPVVVLGSAVLRRGFLPCNTGEPAHLCMVLPPTQDEEAAGLSLRSSDIEGPTSFPTEEPRYDSCKDIFTIHCPGGQLGCEGYISSRLTSIVLFTFPLLFMLLLFLKGVR